MIPHRITCKTSRSISRLTLGRLNLLHEKKNTQQKKTTFIPFLRALFYSIPVKSPPHFPLVRVFHLEWFSLQTGSRNTWRNTADLETREEIKNRVASAKKQTSQSQLEQNTSVDGAKATRENMYES